MLAGGLLGGTFPSLVRDRPQPEGEGVTRGRPNGQLAPHLLELLLGQIHVDLQVKPPIGTPRGGQERVSVTHDGIPQHDRFELYASPHVAFQSVPSTVVHHVQHHLAELDKLRIHLVLQLSTHGRHAIDVEVCDQLLGRPPPAAFSSDHVRTVNRAVLAEALVFFHRRFLPSVGATGTAAFGSEALVNVESS